MFWFTTLQLNCFWNSYCLDLKIGLENFCPNFFQIFQFLFYTLTLDPQNPQNLLMIRSKKIHECSICSIFSDKIDKFNLSQLMREIQEGIYQMYLYRPIPPCTFFGFFGVFFGVKITFFFDTFFLFLQLFWYPEL